MLLASNYQCTHWIGKYACLSVYELHMFTQDEVGAAGNFIYEL